jgi:hypothetical protein
MITEVISYYLTPSVGGVSELHRIRCSGSATPVSDATVAHHVDPATIALTCSTACTGAPAKPATPTTPATPAIPVPEQVTLTFSVTRPQADAYEVVLTGQRRQT